jgi:hypothetical protein
MTSLDALMDVVRAQMEDARRVLACAEMRHNGPLEGSQRSPRAGGRRGSSALEAAFAPEAEALRGLVVDAHAELDKLERLAGLERQARGPRGRPARDCR